MTLGRGLFARGAFGRGRGDDARKMRDGAAGRARARARGASVEGALRGASTRVGALGRALVMPGGFAGGLARGVVLGASFVGGARGGERRRRRGPQGGMFADPDRACTDAIIIGTCGVFALQLLSGQVITALGAKVNERIAAGELWRLVTPMTLHGGLGHLMVNMYSLNSIGPLVEATFGREQFMATYLAAGVAGTLASYRFVKANSLGASGAVFGLAGALAVYLQRHKRFLGERADMQLKQIGTALAVNMMFGLTSQRIDNWGHLGGLVGGAAIAYLTGPNLVLESDDPTGRSMRRKLVNRPLVQSAVRAAKDFWDEDDDDE